MTTQTLKQYLDARDVPYVVLTHSPAYTAQEVAQSAHIRGHLLAKSVVLSIDNQLALAVIPASQHIDLVDLKRSIRAFKLDLASEDDFKDLFPGCELGALPPFGNLYGMQVYIAECLAKEAEITFCAGSHSELIQMDYRDFARLVEPVVITHGAVPNRPTPPRMKEHLGVYP
ncbi:aminoacyl-tRNA deacylase [Motiliproteus sp. SC1-56]|uniref:aminoacyl-tRNA deacylase n=1 Tax=Motiliproteus sp. SC1-56 TaxID=2799565 RepID=UPI001A8D3FCC|nr:YbaK/EbsC family protein [Motiliproteus sp. SC1-56]